MAAHRDGSPYLLRTGQMSDPQAVAGVSPSRLPFSVEVSETGMRPKRSPFKVKRAFLFLRDRLKRMASF